MARTVGAAGILLALLTCAGLSLAPMATAQAQTCWISGPPHLALGDVTSAGGSAVGQLTYTCNNYSGTPRTVTACLYMNPSQPDGVAPRRMVRWGSPHTYLSYDLYANPGYSQIIGSEGSGHAVHVSTLQLGPNGASMGSINLYARAPAGQSTAAGHYESQMTAVLRYAYGSGARPPTAADCLGGARATNHATVTARFANTCLITAATDLEFGSVSILDEARDQTSAIQLQCPTGTVWRVGLDNGIHSAAGARRMVGPGGGHVRYDLYRDPGRSQRWGNTRDADTSTGTGTGGSQSLTVYGRVPAQETPAPGTYSDTITVTLTF